MKKKFSSGGLTGTDQRNRLAPELFEALQILKDAYKHGIVSAVQETEALEQEGSDELELRLSDGEVDDEDEADNDAEDL